MKKRQKMELLKQRMRKDPEVRIIHLEQNGTVICLKTNRKMVIVKRKKFLQIINLLKDIDSPKQIEKVIKHYCYKILQEEVKVVLKRSDKKKKKWEVIIKCRNTSNPAGES